jgi:RNA polymerase sigma-70 factor, ECF subfamily
MKPSNLRLASESITLSSSTSPPGPTNDHGARQSIQDFRAELRTMIPQLRAFTRMLSNDRSSADELSLKTLVEAWYDQFAFEPETNLKAWLFTIARNKFHSHRLYEWREAPPLEQVEAKNSPSHGVAQIRSAHLPDTMRALRFLPDQFREALILVSASGFSYEEAAKICDCPVGTVKSRVFRARQALVASFDTISQSDDMRPQA